jgi:beta-glucosidase
MVADGPHGLRKQAADADNLGIGDSVPATCFPTAATLASSWDRDLVFQVGRAIAEACRQENVSVLLGPGANIKRSPLCGRNFEYYSEDPYVTGEMATAFIRGVQSQGVGTSLKHFAANNQEYHRFVSDSVVDERTLREIYLTGFEMAVKNAQPWTVMCAYNKINGTYCSDSHRLLTGILREEWGFEGVVISDWGGTNDRLAGIKAGMDLEMPSSRGGFDQALLEALKTGQLDRASLDVVAARLLNLIMKSEDRREENTTCDAAAHHRLARRAAAESAVLLKNEGNLLPLGKDSTIAVIGDMARHPRYQGHGSSLINPLMLENALAEISRIAGQGAAVTFAPGYQMNSHKPDPVLLEEAAEAARGADVAVIFAGLPPVFESEGYDREKMAMPASHDALIEKITEVNDNVVVVLSNGAPVEMPWLEKVKSVLETYLGGQASGGAAADILFGLAGPGGRLAETFPLKGEDTASHAYFPGLPRQVQYREGLYVGYRYFDTAGKDVRFPFGYGLSYTQFAYSDFSLSAEEITEHETLTLTLTVTNTGETAGHEVVQCYVHDPECSVYRPEQELKDFVKICLAPGESSQVTMTLDRRAFAYWDVASSDWQVEAGAFEIRVGASSRDIKFRATLSVTSGFAPAAPPDMPAYHELAKENFAVSDEAFARALGRPVPNPDPVRPFHINSTMGEIRETVIGRLIFSLAKREALKLWKGELDDTVRRIIETGIEEAPLRSMVLLTGGRFTFPQVHGIINILNGKVVKGLGMILGLAGK